MVVNGVWCSVQAAAGLCCTAVDEARTSEELTQLLGQLLHVAEDPAGAEAQLIQRLENERQEQGSTLGVNLARWEAEFQLHQAECDLSVGSQPGQIAAGRASDLLLQFVREFTTRAVAHCEQRFVARPSPSMREIVEAAVQAVVLSEPVHAGIMRALHEKHLEDEVGLLKLRCRLEERGCTQLDFEIPQPLSEIGLAPAAGTQEPWGQVCCHLRRLDGECTATAQLRQLMLAARAVYSTVQANQPPKPAKQWTLGADEFTPIFTWAVAKSGATNLYACVDFMEECGPPSLVSSEGGYYLMQLRSALMMLRWLNESYPWPEGEVLPIGVAPEVSQQHT
eukprot:COSAG05_NODE_2687_length_2770_cov_1.143766_1_plen_337_part_00